jgi:hypothetical protein
VSGLSRCALLVLAAAGCSSPEATPPAGPLDLDTRSAAVGPSAERPPPDVPEKPWRGEPFGDSLPPGVKRLDEAEGNELAAKCKPLEAAVFGRRPRGGSTSDAATIGVAEGVLEVLADPPPLQGIDVKRCASLLERDVKDFLARAREARGAQALRTVLLALSDRDKAGGAPCPAAPPVPADVTMLAAGPYESKPRDFEPEGWRCAKYNPLGAPQQFQIEIVRKGDTYRVVARLYPVKGGPISELYVETPVKDVDVGTPILRRVE